MLQSAKQDETIKKLLEQFDLDCPLDLDCICCDSDSKIENNTDQNRQTLGFYDSNTKETRICAGRINNEDQMQKILYEELSHALQGCGKIKTPKMRNDCEQCLCREIQAKFGNPSTMPVDPSQNKSFIELLTTEAHYSCYEECRHKNRGDQIDAAQRAFLDCMFG